MLLKASARCQSGWGDDVEDRVFVLHEAFGVGSWGCHLDFFLGLFAFFSVAIKGAVYFMYKSKRNSKRFKGESNLFVL